MASSMIGLTRERRRELTREHILAAAADVFARDGFHGASIDAIAELAGFTKGAVYSNFESKDDLFLAVADQAGEQQLEAVKEALATDDDAERVANLARVLREQVIEKPGWMALNLEVTMYALRNPDARVKVNAHQRMRRRILTEFIEAELVRHNLEGGSARHVVDLFGALIDGISLAKLLDPDEVPADLLEYSLQVISDGVRA